MHLTVTHEQLETLNLTMKNKEIKSAEDLFITTTTDHIRGKVLGRQNSEAEFPVGFSVQLIRSDETRPGFFCRSHKNHISRNSLVLSKAICKTQIQDLSRNLLRKQISDTKKCTKEKITRLKNSLHHHKVTQIPKIPSEIF